MQGVVAWQVKFSELTLDTFRMLQALEWEPSGSLYRMRTGMTGGNRVGSSSNVGVVEEIADPSLPPNPHKYILYRPTVQHLLLVRRKCNSNYYDLSFLCKKLVSHRPVLWISATGIFRLIWMEVLNQVASVMIVYLVFTILRGLYWFFFNIVTQVLGTACEELSTDSVVLLYVSASGIGLLSASLYSWTIQSRNCFVDTTKCEPMSCVWIFIVTEGIPACFPVFWQACQLTLSHQVLPQQTWWWDLHQETR